MEMRTSALLVMLGLEIVFSNSFIWVMSLAHVPDTGESMKNKTHKGLGVVVGEQSRKIK